MTLIQQELHEKALHVAGEYLRYEAQLISILQELDRAKTYLHFQMPSLFAYSTKLLKLSDHVALALIGIARKATHVPELKVAIEEKKITISNARRIVPVLSPTNKDEWLEKAATLSQANLEWELAKNFPQQPAPTKIKYKTESVARLEVDLPAKTLEKLKRAQEILSQKKKAHMDVANALECMLDEFIERHDPLKRATRAERKAKPSGQMKTIHATRAIPDTLGQESLFAIKTSVRIFIRMAQSAELSGGYTSTTSKKYQKGERMIWPISSRSARRTIK